MIGRSRECRISLTDRTVSRRHALIRTDQSGMTIHDAGSKSGTRLDHTAIGGHPLEEGDCLGMGHSQLTVVRS